MKGSCFSMNYGDFVLRINRDDSVVLSIKRVWWAPWRVCLEVTINGATARSPVISPKEATRVSQYIWDEMIKNGTPLKDAPP